MTTLDELLQEPPFSLHQADKERILLPLLRDLTAHHCAACPGYAKIIEKTTADYASAKQLSEIPFLPISFFKHRRLRSVPESTLRTTVQSSGTTGLQSKIELDKASARLTSRAVSLVLGDVTSHLRLPLLIIDHEGVLNNRSSIGASASAILGIMPFGRDPCFALNEDMTVAHDRVQRFLERYEGARILVFGFTFKIWQHFLPYFKENPWDFSKSILLHSGGWKKMQALSVDNETFKQSLRAATQIQTIVNFYGMAEMPGTVFVENTDGLLYPPHYADVIIRDPLTLEPLPIGQIGVVQILSALPCSYPGHSLLTEDLGVIEARDSGIEHYFGHGLRLLGRVPRAELRGCSDVDITSQEALQ